jgi:hypothetical protein
MSTLRTNALEGVDAKNSITIVAGAGNITTTNVQEGLVKAWSDYTTSGSGNSINGSFNVSSISDVGTGDVRLNYTNNMADENYSGFASTAAVGLNHIDDQDTTRQRCRTYSDLSTAADRNHAYFGVIGDLA